MAKKSMVQRNLKRKRLAQRYEKKRQELKAIVSDASRPLSERLQAQAKLCKLPRNASPVRYRNRCELTGRPRGYSRFFGLSRIMIRELASQGLLPGVQKASW